MDCLWLDLETKSKCNLKKCGSYRYAMDLSTEITLFAYALNDEDVSLWDVTESRIPPKPLLERLEKAEVLAAQNGSYFDRPVLENSFLREYFINKKWYDTMITAFQHALPGSLSMLCKVFGLPEDQAKIKDGKRLVQLFCKPHKKKVNKQEVEVWYDKNTNPEDWEAFKKYAVRDVYSMRRIHSMLPKWNSTKTEMEYWRMDMRMNDRGFAVDIDLAEKALIELGKIKDENNKKTAELTNDEVSAATKRDAMLRVILKIYGVDLPDLRKSTVERRLKDQDIPEPVKELLRLRLVSASTSGKKWKVLLEAVCPDGRLHGMVRYGKAYRTLRWGGALFQPQNLPRPLIKDKEDIDFGIELFREDPEASEMLFGNFKLLTSALRGAIIAGPGKKLIIADLASIEGRMLAFLAGETWKLDAYREYDSGRGYDMYISTYAKTFNKDPKDITGDERQMGKVLELALGYGGGIGAFMTFALVYGIDLDKVAVKASLEDWAIDGALRWHEKANERNMTHGLSKETFVALDAIKRMWRSANKNIVQFWYGLENGFREALRTGQKMQAGPHIVLDVADSWGRMWLPSGRAINYPGMRDIGGELTYLGENIYSRKWCRNKTHGGILSGNATQGYSRDDFAGGMLNCERNGYLPVLPVHDEIVAEVPDSKEFTVEGLVKCLIGDSVAGKLGCPLDAKGFETKRYGKD